MSDDQTKVNTGALFPAANCKILRQGPVNIQGKDENLMIVQVTTKDHQSFFEVYQKVGAIFTNDKKRDENDPDMSGEFDYGGTIMKIWGRKKTAQTSGMKYTSISMAPKDANPPADEPAEQAGAPDDYLEDEIPF